MIRHAAAVVVLCLSPSWAVAQGAALTVDIASANIHKTPTTSSPVIGHAARGAVLEVTREVGDWVKVVWPAAPDGVGYIRSSNGSLGKGTARTPASANTPVASRAANEPAPRLATSANEAPAQIAPRPQTRTPAPSSSASHVFGVGARVGGPSFGVGASARAWTRGRLGVQFGLSRYEVSDPITLTQMTSTQFGPSALFAFNDRVSDYTWFRPYVGGGVDFYRSSLTTPVVGVSLSDTSVGYQAFGGGELSFASVPQVSVSAELGYHWFETPYPGYELQGLGLSIAGHWYIK